MLLGRAQREAAPGVLETLVEFAGFDAGPAQVGQQPGVVGRVMRAQAAQVGQARFVVVEPAAEGEQAEGAARQGGHEGVGRPARDMRLGAIERLLSAPLQHVGKHHHV
jgi:hypothetical protein